MVWNVIVLLYKSKLNIMFGGTIFCSWFIVFRLIGFFDHFFKDVLKAFGLILADFFVWACFLEESPLIGVKIKIGGFRLVFERTIDALIGFFLTLLLAMDAIKITKLLPFDSRL